MTTDRSERSSRDYEREAEASRHRLASNLRELSDRLTPGQVIDEVLTYAKGGGGTFLKALSGAAKDNPVPSLLISAGLLMFLSEKTGLANMMGGHHEKAARYPVGAVYPDGYGGRNYVGDRGSYAGNGNGHGIRDAVGGAAAAGRNALGGVAEAGRNAMSGVADAGRNAMSGVAEAGAGLAQSAKGTADQAMRTARRGAKTVGSALAGAADTTWSTAAGVGAGIAETADELRHRADELMRRAQELGGAVGDTTAKIADELRHRADELMHRAQELAREAPRKVGDSVMHAKDTAQTMVSEQPLISGAVGLAIGAAIAALLPKTEAEDKLMGEASDSVKKKVSAIAAEEMEAAKSVASTVTSKLASEVGKVAGEHGVSTEGAVAAVQAATDKLKEAVGLKANEATDKRSQRF